MFSTFIDRVPGKPNRYKVVPENGDEPYYVVLERADDPIVTGTQLNAATLNNFAMDHVKEKNNNGILSFWVGSQDEYKAREKELENSFCLITEADDTDWQDLTIGENFKVYGGSSGYRPQYRKVGNVVTIRGVLTPSKSLEMNDPNDIFTLFTGLPKEAQPSLPYMVLCIGSGLNEWELLVSGGQGLLQRYGSNEYPNTITENTWLPFNATYIAQ